MSIAEKFEVIADEVYAKGKKDERSEFWDIYQGNGKRTGYQGAFYGYGWTPDTFKPKYDIKPESAASMFYMAKMNGLDLVQHLEELGITMSFENCNNLSYTFSLCGLSRIGVVDTRKVDNLQYTFDQGYDTLQTIDKVILRDDGSQAFQQTFRYTYKLKEIRFEGIIGQTINFANCQTLSADSLKNIISCLKDYSASADSGYYTIVLSDTSKALLENEGATSPNNNTWIEYVADLGWNIG